jgi:hypothetical protein
VPGGQLAPDASPPAAALASIAPPPASGTAVDGMIASSAAAPSPGEPTTLNRAASFGRRSPGILRRGLRPEPEGHGVCEIALEAQVGGNGFPAHQSLNQGVSLANALARIVPPDRGDAVHGLQALPVVLFDDTASPKRRDSRLPPPRMIG